MKWNEIGLLLSGKKRNSHKNMFRNRLESLNLPSATLRMGKRTQLSRRRKRLHLCWVSTGRGFTTSLTASRSRPARRATLRCPCTLTTESTKIFGGEYNLSRAKWREGASRQVDGSRLVQRSVLQRNHECARLCTFHPQEQRGQPPGWCEHPRGCKAETI